MRAVSLLIADDHPLYLDGLNALLAAAPDFEVVAVCQNGDEVAAALHDTRPEIALLDLNMPGRPVLDVFEAGRRDQLPTRFVLLSAGYSDRAVFRACEAGAAGLLLKSEPPQRLLGQLRDIAAGTTLPIDECVRGALERELTRNDRHNRPLGFLTGREREVLSPLLEGASNKTIARLLGITEGTVKIHVHNIHGKLGTSSRAQLVQMLLKPDAIESSHP